MRDNLIAPIAGLLHAHGEITILAVEQLADRFRAHALINMNLPNHRPMRTIIRLRHSQRHRQQIIPPARIPAARIALPELGAAVLAVGGGDAAGGVDAAGDLHDEGAVAGLGEEVVVAWVLVAVAALELGGGDCLGGAWVADGELEGPFCQVKVSAGGAAWVKSGYSRQGG